LIDLIPSFDPIKGVSIAIALLVAIIGHEIMHGRVALYYGDTTAKNEGRLSVNPLVHIDPVGTIIVPLMLVLANAPFLFGWAKPVPVMMNAVIHNGGYKGGLAVSLAGVAYNFFVAIVASVIVQTVDCGLLMTQLLFYVVFYNVVLGVFNLWPIPPLDGSNALSYLALMVKAYSVATFIHKMQNYGMVFLVIILATPLSEYLFAPVYVIMKFLLGGA
jgi:Zn-dependent protease